MKKPKHLHEKSYAKYDEIYRIVEPILKPGDEIMLAMLANSVITYEIINSEYMDRPMTQGGESRTYKTPLHDMAKEMYKVVIELCAHFGLSPKSRGDKLYIEPKKKDKIDELMS